MAQVTPENDKKQWAIKVSELEMNDGVLDVTTDLSNKVFYESLAYAFLIPIFSVLLSSGFTLVPQHDVFAKPEYWYEICIPWASLMASMAILQALRNNVIFKGYEALKSPKMYIKMFLMLCLNINTSLFICHYIWTDYFGCVTPLPFLYTIAFVFAFPGALANLGPSGRAICMGRLREVTGLPWSAWPLPLPSVCVPPLASPLGG